jgi:hypothetical protein
LETSVWRAVDGSFGAHCFDSRSFQIHAGCLVEDAPRYDAGDSDGTQRACLRRQQAGGERKNQRPEDRAVAKSRAQL